MTETARIPDTRSRPGDLWVRLGVLLFLAGAVGTLATVAPLFFGADPLPTGFYLLAMVMPIGLACSLVGVLRSAYAQRRAR